MSTMIKFYGTPLKSLVKKLFEFLEEERIGIKDTHCFSKIWKNKSIMIVLFMGFSMKLSHYCICIYKGHSIKGNFWKKAK